MDSRLNDALDKVASEVEGLRDDFRQGANSNASSININAGGIGVWISVTACAVMLGVGIFGAVIIVDQQRKISDLQHYLNAIYLQAPQLKPDEGEQS